MDYKTTFINGLNAWAKGDALQGKMMVGMGILLSLLFLRYIFNSDNALIKGMMIPIGIVIFVNLVYGSVLSFSRPKHIVTTTSSFHADQQQTIQKEKIKMQNDNKNYTLLKRIWAVLIMVCGIAFFVLKSDYTKGLSLGFLFLFASFLLLDTLLHQRMKPYLHILNQYTS